MAKNAQKITCIILALSGLAACASPSIGMLGAERADVNVDGVAISVFVKGKKAEAIRTSFAKPSQSVLVREALEASIVQVSGCDDLSGLTYQQTAVLTADLKC